MGRIEDKRKRRKARQAKKAVNQGAGGAITKLVASVSTEVSVMARALEQETALSNVQKGVLLHGAQTLALLQMFQGIAGPHPYLSEAAGGGAPLFIAAAIHHMRFAHSREEYLQEAARMWAEAEGVSQVLDPSWSARIDRSLILPPTRLV